MSRTFLVFMHTSRTSALDAAHVVLLDLLERGIQPLVVDFQVRELFQAPVGVIPDGLIDLVTGPRIERTAQHENLSGVELCLVLGGDGTILRALNLIRDTQIPIHGINLGHLGFLAESEPRDFVATLDRLIDGAYTIEERSTLDIEFWHDHQLVSRDWALNDCSIEKADRQKMINVALGIDERPVSTFGCDAVLLSTPTGSTAYSFSAGGPVVWPEVDAMLVVPVAAHALFARPFVLGRSSGVTVELTDGPEASAVAWLDGLRGVDLRGGMRIEATVSSVPARLVRLADTPFSDRLVSKFRLPVEGWRGRPGEIR